MKLLLLLSKNRGSLTKVFQPENPKNTLLSESKGFIGSCKHNHKKFKFLLAARSIIDWGASSIPYVFCVELFTKKKKIRIIKAGNKIKRSARRWGPLEYLPGKDPLFLFTKTRNFKFWNDHGSSYLNQQLDLKGLENQTYLKSFPISFHSCISTLAKE